MKHKLIVNGLEAPLLRQFGCDCDRCNDPAPQANTSVSLISLDENGDTAYHILFDVGVGVTDSLRRLPYLAGVKARLDWLVLTHWHPDHVNNLNRLLVSYHLNQGRWGKEKTAVSLYCRTGTAGWLQAEHAYEWGFMQPHLSDENNPPGVILPSIPIPLAGVTVTPVTVSHYGADRCAADGKSICYSCAAYVIETAASKIVLLWDIDSENEWLVNPETDGEKTAVSLLSNADILFIDTTYWLPKEGRKTHPGFHNVQRIARTLNPRQTMLMHLSGHPDRRGNAGWGWTNARWQAEAQKVWAAEKLPGTVGVPTIGDEFELAGSNGDEEQGG